MSILTLVSFLLVRYCLHYNHTHSVAATVAVFKLNASRLLEDSTTTPLAVPSFPPKSYFKTILPFASRYSEWSLSLKLSNKIFYAFLISPFVLHDQFSSFSLIRSSQYCLVKNSLHGIELPNVLFVPSSCHLISLRTKYSMLARIKLPWP